MTSSGREEGGVSRGTQIAKVGMPKWGLSMTEGKLIDWLVDEGEDVTAGTELVEVETEKIAGTVEAPTDGVLRRRVASDGQVVPVGGLVAVIAPADVPDAEIDAFVAEFQANFVPPETSEDAEPPTQTVDVDGRKLRCLATGDGDGVPLVFAHGFGGDLNNWLFNTEKLSSGRMAYAIDLPGHGESDKQASEFADLVTALDGFLRAQGIDRAHLVGHSMGGAVALKFAADNPDRVASLTLIDSAGLGPEINDGYVTGFVEASRRRELKGVLELLFADTRLVTRHMVDDVLKYKRKDGVDAALRALADDMFPGGTQSVDLRAALDGLEVPVLVIWGAQDQVVPSSHAEGLPDGVEVHVLADQGHSPHMEAANECNRLIGGFVERLRDD
jgi:pyruvate dehydrogenase E2 component (dihydrolipoamide acetyltransferase)